MNRLTMTVVLVAATAAWSTESRAATLTVGNCPAATHTSFQAAYNQLGTTGGQPHTLRLCPNQAHTSSPVTANWGHSGLVIESVSADASNTSLTSTGTRILTAGSQDFMVRNLTLNGNLVANGYSNITISGVVQSGDISTNGNITLDQSSIDGDLTTDNATISMTDTLVEGNVFGRNGVTSSNTDINGSITATNGEIDLNGGTIDASIGTDGNNQPISLDGVIMIGGSVQTASNEVTISNSSIGSSGNPVPVTANNGIDVSNSEIWGDLTAANWAEIFLNATTAVYGTCTPDASGPGTCGLADLILTANGQSDSPVLVNAGESIDLEAIVSNCPDESRWRDTWSIAGNPQQGEFSSSACARSPVDNSVSFSTPGQYEISFQTEYCTGFFFFFCINWDTHGSDSITIIVDTEVPQPDGLIDYRMEQTEWPSEPVVDDSGNGHDALAVNGAETSFEDPALGDPDDPSVPGTCRYADLSSSARLTGPMPDELNASEDFTLALWLKMPGNEQQVQNPSILAIGDLAGTQYAERVEILRFGSELQVRFDYERDHNFNQDLQIMTAGTLAFDGEWHHIAVTRSHEPDGNRIDVVQRIYVDGSVVAEEEQNFPPGLTNRSFLREASGSIHIAGFSQDAFGSSARVDDVRIFTEAFGTTDINTIRNRVLPCEAESSIDHIRLEHSGSGLTCIASPITVRACANPQCTESYSGEVQVTFTAPDGNWSPNPVTITEPTSVDLQYTTAGSVTLNAISDPPSLGPTRCFSSDTETCVMDWAEAGFVIDVPDHVSGQVQPATISAVQADDENQACVPAFSETQKSVDFWSTFLNPTSGFSNVVVNNEETPATHSVFFDANGQAEIQVQYLDAGQVRLHAEYQGTENELDEDLVLTGYGNFTSRPATFTLEVPENPDPVAENHEGERFKAAGEPFQVSVFARNSLGGITRNFGRETPTAESVSLDLNRVAPEVGMEPDINGSFEAFGLDCQGGSGVEGVACGSFNWPEVGIITLTPHLASGSYLGSGDVIGSVSENIGRFFPDRFTLSGGTLIDRAGLSECSSPFTYVGEQFDADFTLLARNVGGGVTSNYEGDFAFLDGDALNISGTEPLEILSPSISWMAGSGDALVSVKMPRSTRVEPLLDFTVETAPVDSDSVSLDGSGLIGSTELRFGRIVIDNAIGSELGPLELPWRTEYWDGSTWLTNSDDNCTALTLADDIGLTSSGGASGDGATPVSVGGGQTSIDESESELTLSTGVGSIHFSAPGSPGWVNVLLLGPDTNWPYLRDELDDDSNTPYEENPEARATFGLFDGNTQRIYIREIAPQ